MADWELWAHMPKATVREAVLLSLGLEPRPPVLTWTQYEAPRSYAEPGREFERRLMLAAAHVDASGPLHPLGSMPSPEDATVSLPEFGAWARGLGWVLPEQFLAMSAAQAQQAPEPQAAPVVAESATGGDEWKAKARARAVEIIERQRKRDLYPPLIDVADEIAREFRAGGVMGASGKPLTGSYIKRHALKGISSAQGKRVSTSIRRGK